MAAAYGLSDATAGAGGGAVASRFRHPPHSIRITQVLAAALWPCVAVVVSDRQLGMAYGLMTAFQVAMTTSVMTGGKYGLMTIFQVAMATSVMNGSNYGLMTAFQLSPIPSLGLVALIQ
jgi:hypothetical protein